MRGKINRFSLDTLVAMFSGARFELDLRVKSSASRRRVETAQTHAEELMENPVFRKLSEIEGLCGGVADLIHR